jgi:ribosome biogenesis GTPase
MYELVGVPGLRFGVARGTLLYEDERPAVGDWVGVRLQAATDIAPIEVRYERTSAFVRRAAGKRGDRQVVAANIDAVLVVCAIGADFNIRRIERYLAPIRQSGAEPVVVVSKADLTADLGGYKEALAVVAETTAVHFVSALHGDGVEAIRPYVGPGRTVALVGSSGAGKSTLTNALLGDEVMAVNTVRGGDDHGRHTTTHRQLLPVSGGGCLVDTPGMRELQLWDGADGLEEVFADIHALAEHCAFRDCAHDGEPGCAVLAAIGSGELDPGRLKSYGKLGREIAREERRHDVRAQLEFERARTKRYRAITKRSRGGPQHKR